MNTYTNAFSLLDLTIHKWVERQSLTEMLGLPQVEVDKKASFLSRTTVESDWLSFDDLGRVASAKEAWGLLETLFGAAVEEAKRVLGEEGRKGVIRVTAEWVNAIDRTANPFLDRGFFRLRIITNPKA